MMVLWHRGLVLMYGKWSKVKLIGSTVPAHIYVYSITADYQHSLDCATI